MRAYLQLSNDVNMDSLRETQVKMKGHRRVIDSADNVLKLKANVTLTNNQIQRARITENKRQNKIEDAHLITEFKQELAATKRRKNRLNRTELEVETDKINIKKRLKKSKVEGPKHHMKLKDFIDKALSK